ncbi:unnamed protein product [Somion occarium]|uniref:Uncharacterized protein n=1 Tax=Somion occarium TaxID=3059160 RepID=A0ABP1D7Z9_9APHY
MSKFTPTAAEVALVNQIFAQADTQKLGVVTGDAAVKIFGGSKLSPSVLAEVWALADEDNNGVLTRKGVAVAVRLLGHAQHGEGVSDALVHKPGPVPIIEGLNAPIAQQTTGIPTARSPPPGLPPLTPQDKAKFMKLFIGCGPVNGLLSGEKARDVLVKSKLPVDKLSQIWFLADTKNRGALDAADFIVAMYLIQASMSGQLKTIPAMLPSWLHEQAKSGPESLTSHTTGESGSFSPTSSIFPRPVSTIQPQYTGQSLQPQMTGQALRPTATGPALPPRSALGSSPFPLAAQQTSQTLPWDVSPTEKINADRFFDTLDTHKRGYIDGEVAVPFFVQSKLPDDVLAQIWDLSDLNNDGLLTRDGFAVAMHLIQSKLAGKELPPTLPPTLVPPSMRSAAAAPPPQPAISETMRDLLWDDTPPASSTTPQVPPPTLQPQATGTLSPQHTAAFAPPQRSVFGATDPFANSPFAPAAPSHKNLLDDDEEAAAAPPLEDKSAEIGNVQNQLNSTNRSLQTTTGERANLERTLTEQAAQLSALQTQLSSAKAAYETETRLLTSLRERFNTQTADIQKAREELIHGESDLSAVRVEKAEIEGAVLRDKEEVRDLNRKMAEVGTEVEALKAAVEKAKKEAKQQKGLLAIAKKQLATREAEKARVEKELEEAQVEAQSATKELEETEAALATQEPPPKVNGYKETSPGSPDSVAIAAAHPLPASPPEVSPLSSPSPNGKSNNPFERLAMASGSPPRSGSPFLPFVNSAALPNPPTAEPVVSQTTAANEDPFGLSDASASSEPVAVESKPTATETTPPSDLHRPPGLTISEGEHDVLSSADTDLFMTPPTTATVQKQSEDNAEPAAATQLPSLDGVLSPQVPGHYPLNDEPKHVLEEHTNLDTRLKELDVEESDSDDDEPLTSVKAKLTEGASQPNGEPDHATPSTSAFDDSFGITATPKPDSSRVASPIPPSVAAASFRSQSPALSSHSAAKDVFGSPFAPPTQEQPAQALETPKPNGVAVAPSTATPGVTEFDEAFGKVPSSSGPSQSSEFTFDSAFDDNFDFAAAKEAVPTEPTPAAPPRNESLSATTSTFPPVPVAATATVPKSHSFDAVFLSAADAGTAPSSAAPGGSTTTSFDEVFSAGPSQPPAPAVQLSKSNGGISFDDAFGGNASETLALDNSFAPSAYQPPPGPPPGHVAKAPFPTTSPPTSPRPETSATPSSEARRSISPPPRQMSPPLRHSSPKPRPSTGSSDKEKPPTRHSKLSIRLPFGRKKKHEAPPVPPISQQQVIEEPTPPADDDIEAVKTLCGMGFSRTQAVTALERHGYDVQRALNSSA